MPGDSSATPASGWTQSSHTQESPIFQARTSIAVRCRCGTRIHPGGTVFGVTTIPPSLESLFQGGVFCSVRCIRAFCLESLEILDAIDAPDSKAMVTDLHEVHRAVAETLARIMNG
jgi:hypothetical protein